MKLNSFPEAVSKYLEIPKPRRIAVVKSVSAVVNRQIPHTCQTLKAVSSNCRLNDPGSIGEVCEEREASRFRGKIIGHVLLIG